MGHGDTSGKSAAGQVLQANPPLGSPLLFLLCLLPATPCKQPRGRASRLLAPSRGCHVPEGSVTPTAKHPRFWSKLELNGGTAALPGPLPLLLPPQLPPSPQHARTPSNKTLSPGCLKARWRLPDFEGLEDIAQGELCAVRDRIPPGKGEEAEPGGRPHLTTLVPETRASLAGPARAVLCVGFHSVSPRGQLPQPPQGLLLGQL